MPAPDPTVVDLLTDASQRLIRTVDGLADDQYPAPSLLPDWTRGHVVAHLALNAEGLAGALTGVVQGEQVPMYRSPDARDEDIEELAEGSPSALRSRLLGSVTDLADAIAGVPEDRWDTVLERTPGSPRTFAAAAVPKMRLLEVEIHHADLGAGYGPADWRPGFCELLIDSMTVRNSPDAGFVLRATDLDRTWTVNGGGPVISGTAGAIGWWFTGRGDGSDLRSESGELPRIGEW